MTSVPGAVAHLSIFGGSALVFACAMTSVVLRVALGRRFQTFRGAASGPFRAFSVLAVGAQMGKNQPSCDRIWIIVAAKRGVKALLLTTSRGAASGVIA